jgi:hypothetical protein
MVQPDEPQMTMIVQALGMVDNLMAPDTHLEYVLHIRLPR